MKKQDSRITVRIVAKDAYARIQDIREQSIPASPHEIALFLRRAPFREAIASALLSGGSIIIEQRSA